MVYWIILLPLSLVLMVSCGRDPSKSDWANYYQQIAKQQAEAREAQQKAADKIAKEQKAKRKKQLKKLRDQADGVFRHGPINISGPMFTGAKNGELVSDYAGVFEINLMHGMDGSRKVVESKYPQLKTIRLTRSADGEAATRLATVGWIEDHGGTGGIVSIGCSDLRKKEKDDDESGEEIGCSEGTFRESYQCPTEEEEAHASSTEPTTEAQVALKNLVDKVNSENGGKPKIELDFDKFKYIKRDPTNPNYQVAAETVILCGRVGGGMQSYDIRAKNLILRNFYATLQAPPSYLGTPQIMLTTSYLYLQGHNKIDSLGTKGGQRTHVAPKITIAVDSPFAEGSLGNELGGKLIVEAQGAVLEKYDPDEDEEEKKDE